MATLTMLRESTTDGSLPSHAWPGGYQLMYLTEDGLFVCPKCANKPDTSDPVTAGDVYWEGPTLACEDCGEPIESAYGDPDAGDDAPVTEDDGEPLPAFPGDDPGIRAEDFAPRCRSCSLPLVMGSTGWTHTAEQGVGHFADPDGESFGPVVNPDGSPTDVTLEMFGRCSADCGCAGGQPSAECEFVPSCGRCNPFLRDPDPLDEPDERDPYEVYGTPEHEALLIAEESGQRW